MLQCFNCVFIVYLSQTKVTMVLFIRKHEYYVVILCILPSHVVWFIILNLIWNFLLRNKYVSKFVIRLMKDWIPSIWMNVSLSFISLVWMENIKVFRIDLTLYCFSRDDIAWWERCAGIWKKMWLVHFLALLILFDYMNSKIADSSTSIFSNK